MNEPISVPDNMLLFETTAAGFAEGDFFVHRMDGVEALSMPYEFRLVLACTIEGGVGPEQADDLLSSGCKVAFGPGGIHTVSGVLREIEQLEMTVDARESLYRVVLVPRFWLTTQTRRSRAFNEMSIPDIIRAVLAEMQWAEGTDFELRLSGSYPAREYVVQYEESDFAFLSRWMERLGIYYYFEQSDDRELLVIADSNAAMAEAPEHAECQYNYQSDFHHAGGINRFRRRNRLLASKVHVRDHNWRTPAKPVVGDADVDPEHGYGLQAFFGDHFKDDGEGARYATLRAELLKAGKEIYTGLSNNHDFAPGLRFSLTGAPVGDLDQQYALTRVVHRCEQEHEGGGTGEYKNEIEAIPYATTYRPPRVTPWPRIDGIVPAKIDAESINSASPIDDLGRYTVVLPFDLYGAYGGKATRRIRKAEPYAGGTYGMHMTLHVGAEVMLAHVGGDPDRPIIIGCMPNEALRTPLGAPNATRSAIRTRSGILIDFQDDAG